MIKIILVWLAVLAFSLFRVSTAGKDSSESRFWVNIFMWSLIFGIIMMLSMCFGGAGGAGGDCSYSNSGYTCS